ncbi:MAG: hypothetical protein PHT44_03510 [Candidatus Portnoybacteria bacterium]|nr:hypothetical protein [Candidatus Portnoybacteria bacterium]
MDDSGNTKMLLKGGSMKEEIMLLGFAIAGLPCLLATYNPDLFFPILRDNIPITILQSVLMGGFLKNKEPFFIKCRRATRNMQHI